MTSSRGYSSFPGSQASLAALGGREGEVTGFQGTAGQRPWGAVCALDAEEEVSPLGGTLGQNRGGQTQGGSVSGWDQLLGGPWADNGFIKERVQAGRSWAWPQQGGECGELRLLLLASQWSNCPLVGGSWDLSMGMTGQLRLRQLRWSWPPCLA